MERESKIWRSPKKCNLFRCEKKAFSLYYCVANVCFQESFAKQCFVDELRQGVDVMITIFGEKNWRFS
jgi:hypothetical protein